MCENWSGFVLMWSRMANKCHHNRHNRHTKTVKSTVVRIVTVEQ